MYNLIICVLSYTEKGTILACYCTTEPEAWFLGRVIETCWTASAATRGDRGEQLKKNTKYITVMKIQEVIGGTHFFEELEGVEGQVIVPAECVICTDVEVIFKGMPKSVAEAAMGDEWEDLTPPEIRTILSSEYLYLGLPQRELIWSKSPQ
jgi:hypothetical protein